MIKMNRLTAVIVFIASAAVCSAETGEWRIL